MSFMPPEPNNFTFKELSLRWGVSEERIERYFMERRLKQLGYEKLIEKASTEERKRITSLADVLKQFARKQIAYLLDRGPLKPGIPRQVLSKTRREALAKAKKSDQAFQSLVEAKGHNIDYIQLIIPRDEIIRFEKKYSSDINCTIPSLDSYSSNTVTPHDEIMQINPDKEIVKDLVTESNQKQKKGVSPCDVTGRKEAIKIMVLEGLESFYAEKGRLPKKGEALQEFLNFISKQFSLKPKPDYLTKIVKISCAGTPSEHCITIKKTGVEKPMNRKYVSNQFYTFMQEFVAKMLLETSAKP